MTTPTITCEQFADHLADFLERDIDEPTRARMESHALGCDPCGALLADLRTLRIDAANLPDLIPSRDLWPAIAERIRTPVVELTPGGRVVGDPAHRKYGRGLGRRMIGLWIGVAAAGLVAITAVITHEMTKRSVLVASTVPAPRTVAPADTPVTAPSPDTSGPSTSPPVRPSTRPPAAAALVSNRPSAQQTYDAEITRLRTIVAQRRSALDTATVGVIDRNLKVIDDAIAQCKQALRKDPASRFLMESLNDALDTKVQLLRTAATLPPRT